MIKSNESIYIIVIMQIQNSNKIIKIRNEKKKDLFFFRQEYLYLCIFYIYFIYFFTYHIIFYYILFLFFLNLLLL